MQVRDWRTALLSASLLSAAACVSGGNGADGTASATESGGNDSTASNATDGATAPGTAGSSANGTTDPSAGHTDDNGTDSATGSATATMGSATDGTDDGETQGDDTTGMSASDGGSTTDSESTGDSDGGESSSGGEPPSDDPFDPTACTGVAWTGADATAHLGGLSREVLDGATIQIRERACPGGACGAWGPNADWSITYLTYSGGVTTRWMDLLATVNLVLFDDGGVPTLSIQHTTFAPGGYPDDDGMLYEFPPSPITYPHIRAFNQFPRYDSDYIDLDYQVTDGTLVLGEDCASWTAEPFGKPEPHTEQYGVLFRW